MLWNYHGVSVWRRLRVEADAHLTVVEGPTTKGKFRFPSFLGRHSTDERGSVLVQFTIYLVTIMGMLGLALDGARFVLVK
jgi:hypothetical protein